MNFTCCYRDKNGACGKVVIEANDREGAFRKAKAMNLNVVSMLDGGKTSAEVSPQKKEVAGRKNTEKKVYKAREHSYILGYLLGPLGFVLACLVWKQRGMKYATYGLGMALLTLGLWWFFGIWGAFCGMAFAVVIERLCIPKTQEEQTAWEDL